MYLLPETFLHLEYHGKPNLILFCWHFSCISSDAHPPKYRQQQQQHGAASRQASGGSGSPETTAAQTGTMLSEDYAEIVDEEGDYSTPASKYL
jgi:hypothetical protein